LNPPPARLIVLGASNVTLALPLLMDALRPGPGAPLEVVAAHGHGRSYGTWSRIVLRAVPSVLHCDLWSHLQAHPSPRATTRAVLTDVGNDIFYGVPPQRLLEWVRLCAERLDGVAGERVITGLPLGSLEHFGPRSYNLLRRCIFPRSPVDLEGARAAAHAVEAGLERIAAATGARFVRPADDWYAVDRIHPAPWKRREAWAHYMGRWPDWSGALRSTRRRWLQAPFVWSRRPAAWRFVGRERRTAQPVVRDGGATLWLY